MKKKIADDLMAMTFDDVIRNKKKYIQIYNYAYIFIYNEKIKRYNNE